MYLHRKVAGERIERGDLQDAFRAAFSTKHVDPARPAGLRRPCRGTPRGSFRGRHRVRRRWQPRVKLAKLGDAATGALVYVLLVVVLPTASLVVAGLVFLWREGTLVGVLVAWLAVTLVAYAAFLAWPRHRSCRGRSNEARLDGPDGPATEVDASDASDATLPDTLDTRPGLDHARPRDLPPHLPAHRARDRGEGGMGAHARAVAGRRRVRGGRVPRRRQGRDACASRCPKPCCWCRSPPSDTGAWCSSTCPSPTASRCPRWRAWRSTGSPSSAARTSRTTCVAAAGSSIPSELWSASCATSSPTACSRAPAPRCRRT